MLKFKADGVTHKGFAPLTQTHAFKENEQVMVIWADGEISEVFVYEPDNITEDVLNRIMDFCDIQGPNDARVMLMNYTGDVGFVTPK